MKALLLAVFGSLVVAVAPVQAADMPVKAPPRIVAAPAFNWTGFYVGANAGGGWGRNNYAGTNTLAGVPAGSFAGGFDVDGGFAGGQIGYNYQFANNWVVGIEADAQWSRVTGAGAGCPVSGGVTIGCQSSTSEGDVFGTIRARLGYAWNNVLLYGTGGFAWGHATTTTTLSCVGPGCPAVNAIPALAGATSTASAELSGDVSWAAGAGIEWGFLPRWTVRAEYLHLQFDNVAENHVFVGGPVVLTSQLRANTGVDAVRVGVNYLFQ